jgi:hypothetical protein
MHCSLDKMHHCIDLGKHLQTSHSLCSCPAHHHCLTAPCTHPPQYTFWIPGSV